MEVKLEVAVNVILLKLEQPLKAFEPVLVIWLPITTLDNAVLSLQALAGITPL